MVDVRKRDGKTEKFDRAKLERSLRNTGTDEKTAREIAEKIEEKEGITTDEIRKIVEKELKAKDAKAADNFECTRCLAARKAIDAAKGSARLTEENMKRLKLETGDSVELTYERKKHTVKAERAAVDRNEIRLNEDDLRTIGATDGTQIAVRRQK